MKKRCIYGPPERKLKLLETKNSKDKKGCNRKEMIREKLKPKEKNYKDVKEMKIARLTKTRKGRKTPRLKTLDDKKVMKSEKLGKNHLAKRSKT